MPSAFRAGATTIAPVLLGVLPFGLATGVVTAEAGYGVVETVGHSVLIFAGHPRSLPSRCSVTAPRSRSSC